MSDEKSMSELTVEFNKIIIDLQDLRREMNELIDEKKKSPRARLDSKLDAVIANCQLIGVKLDRVSTRLSAVADSQTALLRYVQDVRNRLCGDQDVASTLQTSLTQSVDTHTDPTA